MKKQRTSYITGMAFSTYLIAAVLTSMVGTVNGIIDGIIVSRAVSPDALSVIRLVMPLRLAFGFFIALINKGTTYLASKALGRQDFDSVNNYFSLQIYYTLFISLVGLLVLLPFTKTIAGFITTDERLLPMLESYIPIDLFTVCLSYASTILIMFIRVCGKPKLISRRVAVGTVFNLVFDYLLCAVWDIGVVGATVATSISIILSTAVFFRFFRSKDCILGFVPLSSLKPAMFFDSLKASVPSFLSLLLLPVVSFCLNKVILKGGGADGLFLFCLYSQMSSFCFLFLGGCEQSVFYQGGVMVGEDDFQGLRMLTRKAVVVCCASIAAISSVFFFFPDFVTKLYGASSETIAAMDKSFRFVAFSFLPVGLSEILLATHYVTGHHKMCSWLTAFKSLLPLALISAAVFTVPDLIWYMIPISGFTGLLVVALSAFLVSRKNGTVNRLSLIPIVADDPQVCFSVAYSPKAVEYVYEKISSFITVCESNKENRIKVAIEEIMYNLLDHYASESDRKVFDIRVVERPDGIRVSIKDCGIEYNPIYTYQDSQLDVIPDSDLRLAIAGRMSDSISHRYLNGINCTDLFFSNDKD